jgi:hypothetical protein
MRNDTITTNQTLVVEQCYKCAVLFAFPYELQQSLLKDHAREFYCPNGHSQHYIGKTEAEKERERADRLARQVEAREADIRFEQRRLENARRAHAATKGQLTKIKKRVANGVCPCCTRHFVNVERHIKSQHPDYAEASQS